MSIKKLLCLGIAAAVVCTAVPVTVPAQEVQAETNEVKNNQDFQIEDGVLKKYLGEGGDVIIPESVTSIGNGAFRGCSGLTGVTIPEGVTNIGSNAFTDCSSLTSVTIPKSVTSIGELAFISCSSLEGITVEEGNPSYDSRDNCNAIIRTKTNRLIVGCKNTVIPKDVTGIGDMAFDGCSGLKSVTIPEGVTYIGSCAFMGCSSLTSVAIPKGVASIGDMAFYGCSGLTSVAIPEGVTSIEDFAFDGCSGLTEVTIPGSVTSIGKSAFTNCISLTDVAIPKNVTSIGEEAFWGCSSLASVIIPEGVTSIENGTFSECISLTSVEIPEGVASIGNYALRDCWMLAEVTIPGSVTSIGDFAFDGCSGLTEVTIPGSVTSVGNYAFSSCSGLTSITVEEGNSIYDSRDNCNAIIETESSTLVCGCKNTVIPEGVTSISHDAFYGCSGLTDMTIPKNVMYIGVYAFYGCRNLKRVTISENVTDIYDKTFYGCSSLTSVAIPESVTSIGDKAFGYYGDENGNEQKIPNFVIYGESGSAAEKYAKDNGFTFKIPGSLENISTASVTLDKTSYIYDGKAKTPSVTVKLDGKTLTLNTDYTVSYSDNINAGTAKVTVIGKGNYTGSKTVNFTITVGVADISNATVTLDKTSYIYDGKAKTPSVTVKLDGKTLTLNTDYTVSYSDNINAGTAKVTVTGKGNYTGSKTVNFTIAKAGQDSSITCKKTLYKVAYGTKPFKINAASKSKLTFTSSKPKIVSVDKDTGKVTIKNTGVAIITIKAGKDSVKVTVKVSPKKQDVKSVNVSKGKKLTVKWAKDKTASGYQVQVSTDRKFKKGVKSKNLSKTSYTFTKLKAGKKYYVRMRSYKKSGKETLYSTWSKTKTSNKVKK